MATANVFSLVKKSRLQILMAMNIFVMFQCTWGHVWRCVARKFVLMFRGFDFDGSFLSAYSVLHVCVLVEAFISCPD